MDTIAGTINEMTEGIVAICFLIFVLWVIVTVLSTLY